MGACRHGHDTFDPQPCEQCLADIKSGIVTVSVTGATGMSYDLYPPGWGVQLRKLEPLTPNDRRVIRELVEFHNNAIYVGTET